MNQITFFALLFIVLNVTTYAQSVTTEEALVRETLWKYINGRNQGDPLLLKEAFHSSADLRYVKNDSLRIWSAKDYIVAVTLHKKQDCITRIVYIDIEGNAAQAKIEIEYPQVKFADYLNLTKEKGKWVIAVKTFSRISTKPKRVLFVITSHEKMGATTRKTGLHLGEVSHVYKPIHEAGYEIDFVSPNGGQTYMYGADMNDSFNIWFLRNSTAYYKLTHAQTPDNIAPANYAAIYYVGGHGAMWDLPNHTRIKNITKVIYENKGIVAAVCHGTSGLVNVQLSNGEYLIKDKKLTSFTDNEERAAKQDEVVPFLLESTLKERGAIFYGVDNWQKNVVVDQQLVTGQNPASAHSLALEIINLLKDM